MSRNRTALRESYWTVPETCPEVDKAMEIATTSIKNQTGALRDALTLVIEQRIEAEEKIEELEKENSRLQEQFNDIEKRNLILLERINELEQEFKMST